MFDDKKPYTFDRVVRMILTAALVIGLFLLARYLSEVLLPFVAAVVLAYILNPVVTQFEKRFKQFRYQQTPTNWRERQAERFCHLLQLRGTAVGFTLVGIGIVALALIVLVIPLMASQYARFEESMGTIRAQVGTAYQGVIDASREAVAESRAESATTDSLPPPTTQGDPAPTTRPTLSEWEAAGELLAVFKTDKKTPLSDRLGDMRRRVEGTSVGVMLERGAQFMNSPDFNLLALNIVRRLFAGGVSIINTAVEIVVWLTAVIFALLYLVLLLLDYPEYVRTWKQFLPPDYRERILEFIEEFDIALRRYFRGQFVVAAITGILFALGFSIIGLPMAVPFGLAIGVLNMVPYLQLVALLPAGVLTIIRSVETGSLLGSIVLVLAVFGVVQFLQDAVITPRVMGKITGLRPVAILLGVFIWGKLLGFLGLILAIPLTCLGIAYYRRFVLQHSREATSLTNEPPD